MKVSLLLSLIVMINLACSSEYAFGTKVLSNDTDIGRPLHDLPAGTAVGYLDTGAPGYGEEDAVYLHIPESMPDPDPQVNDNDIRITSFQELAAGSKVTSQDLDMDKQLTILPSTINYLNLRGGQEYNLEDPVYLHQLSFDNYSVNATKQQNANSTGCICGNEEAGANIGGEYQERLPYLSSPVSQNPFVRENLIIFSDGYRMLVEDRLISTTPEVVGRWQDSDIEVIHGMKYNYYHVLNTWLVKISQIDVGPNNYSDINNCNRTCSIAINSANNLLITNDVRLSSNEDLAAGTKVLNFNADQSRLLSVPPLLSFPPEATDKAKITYFDANGNGIYDSPDDVYMDIPDGAPESSVRVNDLRLSGPV